MELDINTLRNDARDEAADVASEQASGGSDGSQQQNVYERLMEKVAERAMLAESYKDVEPILMETMLLAVRDGQATARLAEMVDKVKTDFKRRNQPKATFEGCTFLGESMLMEHGVYSDEQIARSIEAICGKGKPLREKKLWAGVYWCLRWYCNFPVKGSDFCDRIAHLPFRQQLNPACCYDNIRKIVTLSFMDCDCRRLDLVKVSKNDQDIFVQCRTVVLALVKELGRAAAF